MSQGQGGGRPRKFKSVKKLQEAIDAYFDDCDKQTAEVVTNKGNVVNVSSPRPYNVTGLALWLDVDETTLADYEKEDKYKKFSRTIKKAKQKIYQWKQTQLYTPKIAAGVIFDLKNNYGWKDKTEVEQTHKGTVQFANMGKSPFITPEDEQDDTDIPAST